MNECSACHVDFHYNPDVKVLLSAQCDHKVCQPCIARLFTPGPYKCPQCDRQLIDKDFSIEPREARTVDSEVKVRRQIVQIYCNARKDFETDQEYDDYLDLREDLIYRVTNPVTQEDVQDVWRIVEEHKRDNADHIRRTQRAEPRKKFQKILNILEEEGGFYASVNSEWGEPLDEQSAQHPFKQRYQSMLENPPDEMDSRPSSAAMSPGAASGPAGRGVQSIARQMNGGGYQSDAVLGKARHFFFADLRAACAVGGKSR